MNNTFLSLPSSELSCSIGTCFFSLSNTSFILFIRSRSLALATLRWYLFSLGFFGYFSFLFFVTFFISVSSLFLTEVFLSDLDLSERLLTMLSEPLSVCSAMVTVIPNKSDLRERNVSRLHTRSTRSQLTAHGSHRPHICDPGYEPQTLVTGGHQAACTPVQCTVHLYSTALYR